MIGRSFEAGCLAMPCLDAFRAALAFGSLDADSGGYATLIPSSLLHSAGRCIPESRKAGATVPQNRSVGNSYEPQLSTELQDSK